MQDDLHLCLKCHSSTGVFKHFAGKNQLLGFYVDGTLVENMIKNDSPYAALKMILIH